MVILMQLWLLSIYPPIFSQQVYYLHIQFIWFRINFYKTIMKYKYIQSFFLHPNFTLLQYQQFKANNTSKYQQNNGNNKFLEISHQLMNNKAIFNIMAFSVIFRLTEQPKKFVQCFLLTQINLNYHFNDQQWCINIQNRENIDLQQQLILSLFIFSQYINTVPIHFIIIILNKLKGEGTNHTMSHQIAQRPNYQSITSMTSFHHNTDEINNNTIGANASCPPRRRSLIMSATLNQKGSPIKKRITAQYLPKYHKKLKLQNKIILQPSQDRLSQLTTKQIDRLIEMEKIKSLLNDNKKGYKPTHINFVECKGRHPHVYQPNFMAKINRIALQRNIRHLRSEQFDQATLSPKELRERGLQLQKKNLRFVKQYKIDNKKEVQQTYQQCQQKSISSIQDCIQQFENTLQQKKAKSKPSLTTGSNTNGLGTGMSNQNSQRLAKFRHKKTNILSMTRWFNGMSTFYLNLDKPMDKSAPNTMSQTHTDTKNTRNSTISTSNIGSRPNSKYKYANNNMRNHTDQGHEQGYLRLDSNPQVQYDRNFDVEYENKYYFNSNQCKEFNHNYNNIKNLEGKTKIGSYGNPTTTIQISPNRITNKPQANSLQYSSSNPNSNINKNINMVGNSNNNSARYNQSYRKINSNIHSINFNLSSSLDNENFGQNHDQRLKTFN